MRQGFTLIELLVVVLIMGILASVAMPQYFKSVEKARAAEALGVLSSMASAEERHYMKTGSYTPNITYELDVQGGRRNGNALAGVYFHYRIENFRTDPPFVTFRADRQANAGGGLGPYKIYISFPAPGTGERTWDCSPTSAGCKSFLPK